MQRVLNQTRGTVVAHRVRTAGSVWSRLLGLMFRSSLGQDEGLLIAPSSSVHTAFMRFPIDVVFIDRSNRVVKVASSLRPFRFAGVLRPQLSALELPAGRAVAAGVEKGDQLLLEPSG
jgi:hypothetical protein